VFDAPADAEFAAALAKVPASVHLGTHIDETGEKTTWHLNRAHYLEQWSDLRATDGTYSVVQPLVAPLYGAHTDAEVVEALLGGTRKAFELVRATWNELGLGATEIAWRRALHDGVVAGSAFAPEAVTPNAAAVVEAAGKAALAKDGLEVTFHACAHAWDGRFAGNGWLLEMPDLMTKLTWGNAALVSPSWAKAQGVEEGDYLEITTKGGKPVLVPALPQPGQADDSIALFFGLGRKRIGDIDGADEYTKPTVGVGSDVYPARTAAGFWASGGATVRKTTSVEKMAHTQEHNVMEGRPLARETNLVQFRAKPGFAKEMVEYPKKDGKPFNLFGSFEGHEYNGHKWGMVIDLNACTGCNACMIACQAENNIPLVGKDGVIRGREMHWIRVDRYFEGENLDDPTAIMQPIGCQHCENAPCELVCPVAATSHSPEGLNDIAYNRCVGTRYCANNCPYKVRRFNYFNYAKDIPELRRMQFNPNVTVRSRGVIEKCSYCVQRIQEAKIAGKREQRDRLKDGEVVAACQQGCPADAIAFGDLNDPASKVAKAAANERAYKLLEELNVRPRTQFLAQIRNPNPELEA
jgi:molybdopterin-containing oxidoreductase family iron-sulfur binding subunit